MTGLAIQHVEFGDEFTIISASEWYQRLRPLLETGSDLRLEMARVTEFDTAGLQLLLAARAEAQRLGSVVTVVDPSEAVRNVLSLVHLADPASEPSPAPSPTPSVSKLSSLTSQENQDANR